MLFLAARVIVLGKDDDGDDITSLSAGRETTERAWPSAPSGRARSRRSDQAALREVTGAAVDHCDSRTNRCTPPSGARPYTPPEETCSRWARLKTPTRTGVALPAHGEPVARCRDDLAGWQGASGSLFACGARHRGRAMNRDKYCDGSCDKLHRRDSGAESIATTRLMGGVVVAIHVANVPAVAIRCRNRTYGMKREVIPESVSAAIEQQIARSSGACSAGCACSGRSTRATSRWPLACHPVRCSASAANCKPLASWRRDRGRGESPTLATAWARSTRSTRRPDGRRPFDYVLKTH